MTLMDELQSVYELNQDLELCHTQIQMLESDRTNYGDADGMKRKEMESLVEKKVALRAAIKQTEHVVSIVNGYENTADECELDTLGPDDFKRAAEMEIGGQTEEVVVQYLKELHEENVSAAQPSM